MIQDLLTYAAILWALYQVGKATYNMLVPKVSDGAGCATGGCASCATRPSEPPRFRLDLERVAQRRQGQGQG